LSALFHRSTIITECGFLSLGFVQCWYRSCNSTNANIAKFCMAADQKKVAVVKSVAHGDILCAIHDCRICVCYPWWSAIYVYHAVPENAPVAS